MSQILFCKSKVFIHPTSNRSDQLPGFLLVIKESQHTQTQDAKLSWIPENDLESSFVKTLLNVESKLLTAHSVRSPHDFTVDSIYSSWSFTISISAIYSIQFKPPHPNGYWFGSCIINCKNGMNEDIPVLFFHDDICTSTIAKRKKMSKEFDPFSNEGDIYWGGDDLRTCLQSLVDLQKVDSSQCIYLVNASLDDLRNFSLNNFQRPQSGSSSKDDGNIWDSLEATRWSIMSKFADATTTASNLFGKLVKKHPIVQMIDKHSDNVYVKQLMKNPRVVEVQDEFDSAKIYLAKWAMGVKQEAERYQKEHYLDDTYKRILRNELGISNDVEISPEELNIAVQRSFPLTKQKWDSLFDSQGRLSITVHEVKDFIFHGGVENDALRSEVWLFLLGVYPWDSSLQERKELKQAMEEDYNANYKSKWIYRDVLDDSEEEEYWKDQVFRISKDVLRNDRDIPLYRHNTKDGKEDGAKNEEAPNKGDQEEEWEIKNPHLQALKNILISYNIYNPNLGYVQGMTDLLSLIYFVLQDEALSFWCFVNFMNRMERNFLRDQSGIRDQMLTLVDLCQFMLPKFAEHLKKCESADLFFCFRMLLVWFKREFEFSDVCKIWEIFWTDYYSSQFQLFFMLAILQKHSDVVVSQLTEFDDVLKYFNDLRNSMDWSDIMIRSELLFIKFQKMIEVLEREEELISKRTTSTGYNGHEIPLTSEAEDPPLHHPSLISENLKELLSKELVIQKEGPRSKDSIK
ncbi:GTPase-activating protein GYP7 [Kluyveromyces lactis]|uniref:KLLA0D19272p n=1 Tax=Kluyveromyces lactis (strain ATCC 8585 / CBS 2359 / DSM 70799 / NBRC 1267 / NRRL Y-1140 / WM37) TaxID=284590 RepID=Q6CQ72_KLULA|nr:uncharacterized protein KLLA0_D19272g [Kluyveromyces lactis]CAH01013.1 KLLA0D19272p [Kluyveromyces lactis]|eukprot:XP_453917.1 uncharacterized protein KLLA0_D19272g [Kluyveromyces lactis]